MEISSTSSMSSPLMIIIEVLRGFEVLFALAVTFTLSEYCFTRHQIAELLCLQPGRTASTSIIMVAPATGKFNLVGKILLISAILVSSGCQKFPDPNWVCLKIFVTPSYCEPMPILFLITSFLQRMQSIAPLILSRYFLFATVNRDSLRIAVFVGQRKHRFHAIRAACKTAFSV